MNWSRAGSSPMPSVFAGPIEAADAQASSSLATTSGGAPT